MSESDTKSTSHDHEGGIHFNPPLYRQRYAFVLDCIGRDPTLHSLFDIGCGTGQLLTIGRYRNPHIQLIAGIDILRYELDEAYFRLKPLSVEYVMFRRETPLHIFLLQGDATNTCPCFRHFDVVTLIEVIEHLHFKDLRRLVEHVFGHIQPRLVIVTTPNADFNVLFTPMTNGPFRHPDHKFEFTRHEFHNWASHIVQQYSYKVEFHGVGEAPPTENHRHLGTCTQIAIFQRLHDNHSRKLSSGDFSQRLSHCQQHELLAFIDYPFGLTKVDELHEQVRYILEMYRLMALEKARLGHDQDDSLHDPQYLTVPTEALLHHPRLKQSNITLHDLKSIVISTGYRMLNDNRIILCESSIDHSQDTHDNQEIDHTFEATNENDTTELKTFPHPPAESWD